MLNRDFSISVHILKSRRALEIMLHIWKCDYSHRHGLLHNSLFTYSFNSNGPLTASTFSSWSTRLTQIKKSTLLITLFSSSDPTMFPPESSPGCRVQVSGTTSPTSTMDGDENTDLGGQNSSNTCKVFVLLFSPLLVHAL